MDEIKLPNFFNKVKKRKLQTVFKEVKKVDELPFISNGDHFWATIKGNNQLSVFVKDNGEYFIAGAWEGSFIPSELNFIEIIKKPIIKETTK